MQLLSAADANDFSSMYNKYMNWDATGRRCGKIFVILYSRRVCSWFYIHVITKSLHIYKLYIFCAQINPEKCSKREEILYFPGNIDSNTKLLSSSFPFFFVDVDFSLQLFNFEKNSYFLPFSSGELVVILFVTRSMARRVEKMFCFHSTLFSRDPFTIYRRALHTTTMIDDFHFLHTKKASFFHCRLKTRLL